MTSAPVSDFARTAYAEAISAAYAESIQAQFGNVFENAGIGASLPAGFEEQVEEEWNDEKGAPPVSSSCLQALPLVKVTEEDLVQDGNEFCCVCIESLDVGEVALQLPCGHLYHRKCGVDWLMKHCTCPNCRYELQSDLASFESGRVARMRRRRPRFRRRDLDRRSIAELKALMRDHGVSTPRGACEKSDFVDALVDSGSIQIVPEPRLPIFCDEMALRTTTWTTKQLKRLMREAGVDSSKCVEKDELVDAIVDSRRVVFHTDLKDDDQRRAASAATLAKLDDDRRRRTSDLF